MKHLLNQAVRFVGLSGIGWLLDFTVYTLMSYLTENPFISNVISSCVGATFVFLFSTRLIFKNNSRISLPAKYGIYIVYQIVLIYMISRLLAWVNGVILLWFSWKLIVKMSALIAKIFVTPITMIMNFFVMKGVIEKI